ncbi:MAG: fructose-bisphosphate aldolase [Pseudomonas sp.]
MKPSGKSQGRHATDQVSSKRPTRSRHQSRRRHEALPDALANHYHRPRQARRPSAKYYQQGARFAKWRAVIDIGKGIPSYALRDPTHMRSRATPRSAQAAQIVPIVEPEVLMDGDHDIDAVIR